MNDSEFKRKNSDDQEVEEKIYKLSSALCVKPKREENLPPAKKRFIVFPYIK